MRKVYNISLNRPVLAIQSYQMIHSHPHKKSTFKQALKKRPAFTLIELMIAMAIIAILATAGISAYTGYVKKSRDTSRAEIARSLNSAVISYAASNG